MEPEEESHCTLHWQRTVLKTLKSLSSTTTPDCCIIVGTERILTHKTALQLNSALLTAGDAGYNKQSGLIEIDLLPEFSENFDLVSDIVNSFYTGNLEVEEENLKIVYKFAKCYSVQWIMDYLRPMFVKYVKKDEGCERFIEVLKFSRSIWCTDLANACCELLDSELLEKVSQPEVLSQMDLFTITLITTSNILKTPEKYIFNLVTDWINTSPSNSRQDFSCILENIRFELIESDFLLDVVFDFVLDLKNLQDDKRRRLLAKVKNSMKVDKTRNFRCSSQCAVNMLSPLNDECLRKIDNWVKCKSTERKPLNKPTQKEIQSVIDDKFKLMTKNDQTTFATLLCSNDSFAVPNFKQLLILHDTFPSPLFIRVLLELCTRSNGQDYHRLYYIPWKLVSYETIAAMVTFPTKLEELLEFDCRGEFKRNPDFPSSHQDHEMYSMYSERFEGCGQIELIMLWSLANNKKQGEIMELLKQVCFRKMPSEYVEQILFPCLKTIFPDMAKIRCPHKHQENEALPTLMKMRSERMPNKTYQLQRYTHRFQCDKISYELKFSPDSNFDCFSLKSPDTQNGVGKCKLGVGLSTGFYNTYHSFILFDERRPQLLGYPLFVRRSYLSVIKTFVECSDSFRFMFYA